MCVCEDKDVVLKGDPKLYITIEGIVVTGYLCMIGSG